jgi:enoyl-CoA hydratase
MDFENIEYNVEDNIATVSINRPRAMNALNSETLTEIDNAFIMIESDKSVLGVIITGAGDKSFIAGADISELATKDPVTGREQALFGQAVYNRIENLTKPVIAAVNGFALGGGCELAMACHLRVAAAHARFGQPEVGLGLIPGYGGTQRLPRLVGKGIALELMLGGGMIDAVEAFRIGLVNAVVEVYKQDEKGNDIVDERGKKVFDKAAFMEKITIMLKGILTKGPVALAYVISAVNQGLETSLQGGLKIEADLFGKLYETEDTKEGLNAFLERRQADFKGK